MTGEGLHKDHRKRMREKIAEHGIDTLLDHELLELVLGYAIPRKDTNELAHSLLNEFGNYRELFRKPPEELMKVERMGESTAWFIRLLSELYRRYAVEAFEGPTTMEKAKDRIRFFWPRFMGRLTECVYVALLNEKNEVIRTDLIYVGSAEAVEVRADKILELVKKNRSCTGVMVAHNHFHTSVPSFHDFKATYSLYKRLEKAGVELVDHVIICKDEGSSMAESGHLAKIKSGEMPE